MCPSAPRVCSEPGGQTLVLSLSLDRITWANDNPYSCHHMASLGSLHWPFYFAILTGQKFHLVSIPFLVIISKHFFISNIHFHMAHIGAGHAMISQLPCHNTLRPRRNEQHFADDIFKRIFFNENVWISIKTRTPAFWDTPRRPMITHTTDSHQIPSWNNTKSKLKFLKNYQNFKFCNFARNFARDTHSEAAW